jgi:D-alanine-D-alanine ligase
VRIGIFFGGPAREREISYAGGKTAYENMDKALFTPVLVFVDSLGNFILTYARRIGSLDARHRHADPTAGFQKIF